MAPPLHLDLWSDFAITAGAYAIEAVVGYPDAVFRTIKHPVVWVGALLSGLERRLNRGSGGRRRVAGVLTISIVLLLVCGPAVVLQVVLPGWGGLAVLAVVASALPAQRSLERYVGAVATALELGGLAAGRVAVSHIVGRDPETLDEAGVVRAAIESLAENFSDGVVAPAVWGAIAGLAGMAGYKAVNTADSMIGHRTERYAAFGWAAARLDDVVNLPASRLAAVWLVAAAALTGRSPVRAMRAVWRDAGGHRSPNAGWPEAAMAGALGLRLAGPRVYGGVPVEDAWMGDGRAAATVGDLRAALRLYRVACALQVGALVVLVGITWPG